MNMGASNKTIKIVRLERKGRGIFRPSNRIIFKSKIAKTTHERHNYNGFPTPYGEGLDLDKDDMEWFCAYKSVEQLQKWVLKKEMAYFIKMGFKVLLLNVTNFQEGEKQVLYTKDSINSSEDITSLFI